MTTDRKHSAKLQKLVARTIRYVQNTLPKGVQRAITDNQVAMRLVEVITRERLVAVATPDGGELVVNPIFHAELLEPNALTSYEPALRACLKRLIKPGMVLYDVGANIGIFSIAASQWVGASGKVYAFEPDPSNLTCLLATVKQNVTRNVVVEARAVGATVGEASFDRRGGAFSGRLVGDQPQYRITKNLVTVPVTTIDALVFQDNEAAPDIIKIDVEGGEYAVLQGASRVLADRKPIVVCELHSHLGESPEAVCELLGERGYVIYGAEAVAEAGLAELQPAPKPAAHRHVIGVPRGRDAFLC